MKRFLALVLMSLACPLFGADSSGMRPTVSADGRLLLYSSRVAGNGDIFIRDLRTGGTTNLTHFPATETSPVFSADGSQILFTRDTGTSGQLWTLRLADGAERRLTYGSSFDTSAVHLPGTEWIVFTRAHLRRPYGMGGMVWDRWDLCCVPVNGGEVRRLTTEEFRQLDGGGWSSTNTLVFSARTLVRNRKTNASSSTNAPINTQTLDETEAQAVYRASISNSTHGLVLERVGMVRNLGKWSMNHAVWHPKTERIFFTSNYEHRGGWFDYETYSIGPDGTDLQCHTSHQAYCDNLSVSAFDGSLVFAVDHKRNGKLVLMRLDPVSNRSSVLIESFK